MINTNINVTNNINTKKQNYNVNAINNNLINTSKNTTLINNTSNNNNNNNNIEEIDLTKNFSNNIEEIDLTKNFSNNKSDKNVTFYNNTSGASPQALGIKDSEYYSFGTSTSKGENGIIKIKKECLKNLDVNNFNNTEKQTKKSDSHGEYTYIEKNGIKYKHYNSYNGKNNYNVAQLKDGTELVFNNNKLTSITNNEIVYTLKIPTDDSIFKTITYGSITLNNEGKFDKFADMQEIDLSFLYIFNNSSIKKEWIEKEEGTKKIINKTIDELYKISKGDEKNVFERLKNNGLGKIKIIESYNEEKFGFNAVVLQDTDGNYMINYPGTEPEINDVLYDTNNILKNPEKLAMLLCTLIANIKSDTNKEIQKIINQYNFKDVEYWIAALPYLLTISREDYESLANKFAKEANEQSNPYFKFINWWQSGFCTIMELEELGTSPVLADSITNITDYTNINNLTQLINNTQKIIANNLAQKYYEKAKKEGKKLNFSGFSLGGSLAERSYLNLINKNSDESNTLNKITLHNPYHDNLNENEIKTLKEHNIELFCNDGDPISAVFNQEDFKDIAKYINVNYKAKIKQISQTYVNQDDSEKNIITRYSEIARLAFFELHTINPEYQIAYDEFGNLIKKDIKPKTINQIFTDLNNELSK